MKIYLSGPMTGVQNDNHAAFNQAAAQLRHLGYEVLNPVELDMQEAAPKVWEELLRRDLLHMLANCNAVAHLPGASRSRGARLEMHVARSLGWPILPVADLLAGDVEDH